jgi:hypothetical protein
MNFRLLFPSIPAMTSLMSTTKACVGLVMGEAVGDPGSLVEVHPASKPRARLHALASQSRVAGC